MNDRNRNTDTNEIDSRRKPLWYSGRYFDYPLLGIVLGLVLFGLVMVYSTSSYRADQNQVLQTIPEGYPDNPSYKITR